MNNHGQAIMLLLMLGLVVIILALALAPSLNIFTSGVRNETFERSTGMNCSGIVDTNAGAGNISPSVFQRANCLVVDLYLPFFIGSLIAIGGAVIGAKIFFATQ